MGILDNLERGLERAVNGAFAKTFRAGLQPVELTSAIRKEMDTHTVLSGRDLIMAPHRFSISMSPTDYATMLSLGSSLIDELVAATTDYATSQHYHCQSMVSVSLHEDPTLSVGMIRVTSDEIEPDVVWRPVLTINGHRHALAHSRTVVGRGSEADITISDSGVSRQHLMITWDGERAQMEDLGSTNGSSLNGFPAKKAILEPGSTIRIGHTAIVFQVVPTPSTKAPSGTGE